MRMTISSEEERGGKPEKRVYNNDSRSVSLIIAFMTINVSLSGEAHIEFCCHLARGNIDPKETPVYEYVKFVGDFKFHKNGKDISGQNSEILMSDIYFLNQHP